MGYLFLGLAIACEVTATLSLRASEGFSKPLFGAVVVVGYIASFALLSMALQRGMPLGTSYGIWAAIGVASVALISIPAFGETLTLIQGAGIMLVILGVAAIEMGGNHA